MSASKTSKSRAKADRTRRRNAAIRRAMRATRAAEERAERRDTPMWRLCSDGSTSIKNMQRRLQWLAHVWEIPAKDLPRLTNTCHPRIVDFAEKYGVNLDWLFGGELKHLHRMLGKPRMISTQPVAKSGRTPAELASLLKTVVAEEVARALAAKEDEPA